MKSILDIKIYPLLYFFTKCYFICILFLYPYGVIIGGGNNFRLSDLMAIPILMLAGYLIYYLQTIKIYPLLNSILLIFISLEILFPFLGLMAGYAGVGAISNSLRMALIWLPFYMFVLISETSNMERFYVFFRKVLKFSVIVNFVYGLIQILVRLRFLPRDLLFTALFEEFAVDDHFRVTDGIRASGFFVNTTSLSTFGLLALGYFYSRFISKLQRIDGIFVIISFFLILLTTSRTAVFISFSILFFGWFFISNKLKIYSALIFVLFIICLFLTIDFYIGSEVIFNRFYRLMEGGASADLSFSARSDRIWPLVFQNLKFYEYGTLVSAVSKVGLIDSGYLTYYAQGKWPFLGVLLIMLFFFLFTSFKFIYQRGNYGLFLLFCLCLYLFGSMTVLNSIRNPLVIFFLIFALWLSDYNRKIKLHD